jgi:diguanylate cyclase (GGDEF)-like protein
METRLYFQMLRRGWWIIVLTVLTALVASLVASYLTTPTYQAVAQFILSPSAIQTTGNPGVLLEGLNTLDNQSVTTTYATVMSSARIYSDAITFLELRPEDMKDYTYKATVLPTSSVLQLTVTGPNPQIAAKLANAIGYETINFTRNFNQVINIDFLDTATPPTVPSSPQPLRDASLAVLLGVIVGAALTILSEQLRISLEAFRQGLHLDNVTGIYNSKYFPTLVEDRLAKNPKGVLSVGIVELSGLRDIIDTFPATSLQRILQRVTETLRKELRGNDVIGRWNDYSFIVMLPNTSGVAASGIFERIYQALTEPVDLSQIGVKVDVDAHIGGAEYGNSISASELFQKANNALEQARRDSENPVYVWEMKNPFWAQKNPIEN